MKRFVRPLITILLVLVLVPVLSVLLMFVVIRTGLWSSFMTPPLQNSATIVLTSIQDLSVLTTVRYNFSSMVRTEREIPGILASLYGESQMLVAVGHVTAGVDLSQLTEEDIVVEGDVMRVLLPAPTLQDCFLNESLTYVADRQTGIFARSAPELDTSGRRYAIAQFRDSAMEQGILDEARQQAEFATARFVGLLTLPNISQIRIEVEAPSPDAPLPESCQ